MEVVDSVSRLRRPGRVVLAAARGGRARRATSTRSPARAGRASEQIWFSVDTLEYLRRGGRIGGAQAWLGGALKIKPILTLDGEISPVERVRTAARAFERMVEFLRTLQADGATAWIVQHIQAPDQAEALVGRGREIFGHDPLFVSRDRRPSSGRTRARASSGSPAWRRSSSRPSRPARRRPAAACAGGRYVASGRAPGVVRSIAGQPMSRSRSSRSARAPPRRPKRRLARRR